MALAGVTDQIVYLEEGDLVDLQLGRYWIVAQGAATRQALTPAERPVRTVLATRRGRAGGPYRHYMQKKSSSSRAPLPTRSKAWKASCPKLFDGAGLHGEPGAAAWRVFRKSTTSSSWPAAPATTAAAPPSTGWKTSRASHPGGSGQRIPLPHQRAQPAHPGRHHQPKRRNRRHPGRAAPRAEPGHAAHAHHLQRGHQRHGARRKLAYITRAGVEIGVASTKAFTTQLAGLFLLTLALAQSKGAPDRSQEAEHLKAMRHLPVALQAVLALEPQLISWAEDFARMENALFLGRGLHYPIALEGALKLKEISYIHAEALPGWRTQARPLALVTSSMPVVTVAPNDALLEKLKSNMQEVRARAGVLYVLADADTHIESAEGP